MENLRSIGVFVHALELQRFAAVPGLAPPAAIKAVAALEDSLGARSAGRAAARPGPGIARLPRNNVDPLPAAAC